MRPSCSPCSSSTIKPEFPHDRRERDRVSEIRFVFTGAMGDTI
jgi:hypothetical protein